MSEEKGWKVEWKEKIVEWLETEISDSKLIIDCAWETEDYDEDVVRAKSWCSPFHVILRFIDEKDKRFLTLTIYTGVGTAVLKDYEKIYLYSTMLKLNEKSQLIKYCLEDIDDKVIIRSEFDLASFSKGEFNHGLRRLSESGHFFFSKVLMPETLSKIIEEESWEDYEFYDFVDSIAKDLKEKKITPEVAKKRAIKLGYEEEDAETFIENMLDYLDTVKESSEGEDVRDGPRVYG
ncbi:MAG: hypothetical protein R6U61_04275 [Thermoplasmata archaeon]